MKIGDKAKGFTLKNSDAKEISLTDLIKDGKLVLLFFPLAYTGVCTDEMCTIRDNMKLYNSLDTNVAAISVDSFFTLNEFKKGNNLNFTLLSDFNKEVITDYGVYNSDFLGMKGVAKRSVFVINSDQVIEYAEILENSGNLPDFKALQSALNS